jgi:hypothetical protein
MRGQAEGDASASWRREMDRSCQKSADEAWMRPSGLAELRRKFDGSDWSQ